MSGKRLSKKTKFLLFLTGLWILSPLDELSTPFGLLDEAGLIILSAKFILTDLQNNKENSKKRKLVNWQRAKDLILASKI